jgi:hypothetical protein
MQIMCSMPPTEPQCREKKKEEKEILASSINEKKEILVAVPTAAVPATGQTTTISISISLFMSLAVDKQY